ncbi:MAG: NUDIX domain-containing protein [Candidatus Magasanikbacteria bacterium]|nr:NUDIX domain-containing protein [Candidatus Magasanikbacteria bacterium]
MQKILIATTNSGKLAEIMAELADLHFAFVSLKDLKLDKFEVEEPYTTTWQNALEKAKFFAKKSGLLTLAEDTGLFINALNGEPGIASKRLAPTAKERNSIILEKMRGFSGKKRGAYFETSGCLYNPNTNNFSIFTATAEGEITQQVGSGTKESMGYDPIFYFPPLKKVFSEMNTLEKNRISHRGKMVLQVKYFLTKNYQSQQVICAAGIIVKDGKMLLTKRRDIRPEFNDKWEFPGGGVENGESFDETLIREVGEETGYRVSKIEQLPDILTTTVNSKSELYQVHLYMNICKIKSGKFQFADAETSDYGWFTYKEALKKDLLPLNKKLIQSKNNKKVLLKYIK